MTLCVKEYRLGEDIRTGLGVRVSRVNIPSDYKILGIYSRGDMPVLMALINPKTRTLTDVEILSIYGGFQTEENIDEYIGDCHLRKGTTLFHFFTLKNNGDES